MYGVLGDAPTKALPALGAEIPAQLTTYRRCRRYAGIVAECQAGSRWHYPCSCNLSGAPQMERRHWAPIELGSENQARIILTLMSASLTSTGVIDTRFSCTFPHLQRSLEEYVGVLAGSLRRYRRYAQGDGFIK